MYTDRPRNTHAWATVWLYYTNSKYVLEQWLLQVFSKNKSIWVSFTLILFVWREIHTTISCSKERYHNIWAVAQSPCIFSATEDSDSHQNDKMSEGPNPKWSLRPSIVKSAGDCPAKEGMAGCPTLNSVDESYYIIKPGARYGILEQIHSRV